MSLNNDSHNSRITHSYSPEIVDIGVDSSHGVAVVTVTGELDVSNTARLQRCLHDAINSGVTELKLNVEHLTFLGSSGLSVILGAHKRMRATGGALTVVAPTPFVERLFHIADDSPPLFIQSRAVA